MWKGTLFKGILFQKYIEINPETREYRKIHGILHVFRYSEKFQKLPDPDYLLLFKTLYVKCETCTPEEFEKHGVYQLSIVYNKKRKFVLDVTKNLNSLISKAQELSRIWNLQIFDNASVRGKGKWLNG